MKKAVLVFLVGLSIVNADLLNESIEAKEKMNWIDAKRFCGSLNSYTLANQEYMKSLSDDDKIILKDNGRYWLDEAGEFNDAKAYGVYPKFTVDIITMSRAYKNYVLCVKK